jgi:hypothetical protein
MGNVPNSKSRIGGDNVQIIFSPQRRENNVQFMPQNMRVLHSHFQYFSGSVAVMCCVKQEVEIEHFRGRVILRTRDLLH